MGKLYNCDEIAQRYGVKVLTVWAWIREKKLPAINIGKQYRVSEEDLLQFERDRKTCNREEG